MSNHRNQQKAALHGSLKAVTRVRGKGQPKIGVEEFMSGPNGPECVYTCKHYTDKGGSIRYAKGDCPVADNLYDRCISIALNQWYTAEDCRGIADTINRVLTTHCTPDAEATAWLS